MVSDGMQNKIYRMPEDAQMKLAETAKDRKRRKRRFDLYYS